MVRLREKHLPHRVNVRRLAGEGSEGITYSPSELSRPAYVEQKTRLTVDRRTTSSTYGTEVVSSTLVIMLTVDEMPPGSLVTVWPGTPRERTSAVVDSAYFDYRGAPNHVELRLE